MKISEYPKVTSTTSNDLLILDTSNGTRSIKASDLSYGILNPLPAMHNQVYRGNNLGTAVTAAQKTAIKNGTWNNLWLGDYWTIGGTKWIIAGFNYLSQNRGDYTYANHVTLLQGNNFTKRQVYGNTTSAYNSVYGMNTAADFEDTVSASVATTWGADSIVSYNEYYGEGWSNGASVSSRSRTMKTAMITHHNMRGHFYTGTPRYVRITAQMPLFRVAPLSLHKLTGQSDSFWLDDQTANVNFLRYTSDGVFTGSARNSQYLWCSWWNYNGN